MERKEECRVLLVEDNPGDVRLIREYVAASTRELFLIDCCEDLASALTHVARTGADVVLLDLGLPDSQGLITLQSIRKQVSRLPIVVLTGLQDEEIGLEAVKEGAQSYLVKEGLTPALLTATLRYAVARQSIQDELRKERDFADAILQTAQVVVLVLDSAGNILRFNQHLEELSGISLEEARGKDWFESFLPKEDQASVRAQFAGALAGRQTRGNVNPIVTRNGEYRWLEWYDKTLTDSSGEVAVVCMAVDVTEKRRMDRQQALVAEILTILNRRNEWQALIADILETIQTSTGLEAVAIRLEQEGDFPYVAVCGFPPEFVAIERSLVDCDGAGLPKRDAAGKQELACMCGNVIRGRIDPALSFFTEHGSFWTNSTTQLLASTTEKERQSPTRNQCNAFGYESVALIPVRSNSDTIGLLQLNDHRTDQFDAEMIQFFEGLAASIGVAYKRQQAEEQYRMLFERNMAGVSVTALDGRFIACNQAFSDMLGYASPEEMISVHASELYFDAADRKKFLGELRGAREIVGKEFCLRRKDGGAIWVLESACMIQAGNGDTVAIQATMVDVTHLRETEEALRERVKELTCLSQVNREFLANRPVGETIQRVAELVVPAMMFPDKARVRVELAGEWCATEGYADALPPGIDADIDTQETVLGRLSVRYADEQPFLLEEQSLLSTLAVDLAIWHEGTRARVKLKKALDGTVRAVGLVAEMKDSYTSGHQQRVAELACAVASKMGLSEEEIEDISTASLMHDIGKMMVPSEILSKPVALTDIEFSLIKEHPGVAYKMLTAIKFPEPVPTIIVQHHERMDGSGYPDGLKGEAITLAARILAVADVVEAMAAHRPYRPALGIDAALDEMRNGRGKLYDPAVVDVCVTLFEKTGFTFGNQ